MGIGRGFDECLPRIESIVIVIGRDSTFQSPINENDNRSNNTDKGRNFFQLRGIHIANLNIRHIKPKLD